jgi:hypothetical protein
MLQNHPWLVRRNLGNEEGRQLPSVVVGYLLVCLATRPHLVPDEVVVFLASRVLAPTKGPADN